MRQPHKRFALNHQALQLPACDPQHHVRAPSLDGVSVLGESTESTEAYGPSRRRGSAERRSEAQTEIGARTTTTCGGERDHIRIRNHGDVGLRGSRCERWSGRRRNQWSTGGDLVVCLPAVRRSTAARPREVEEFEVHVRLDDVVAHAGREPRQEAVGAPAPSLRRLGGLALNVGSRSSSSRRARTS